MAAVTASAFASGIGALYLNFYFRSLGLDDAAIGALNAAPAVGLVLAAVPTFAYADRFARKHVLLAGGALTFAGTVGVIASSALPALLVCAALFGAGVVVTEAAGFALLSEATAEESRARTFAWSFASVSLAYFVANLVGGSLAAPLAAALGRAPQDPLVLRGLLAVAALIGASSAVPVLLLRARGRPPHRGTPRSWRLLARFAVVNACFGFGAGSFLPFVNLFFAERFRLDFAAVGAALAVVSVAGGLGGLVHARLAPRLGAVRGLASFWSASLPFAVLGAFAGDPIVAVAALVGRGVLMTAAVPTMDAFTMSAFPPRERSAAQAVMTTTWALFHGAGALFSGQVRAGLGDPGYTVNLLTLVASYTLAIAVFVAAFRRHAERSD